MNIRQFAQFCKMIASGQDVSAHLPQDQIAINALAKMARDQRVLPLLAVAFGQNARFAKAVPAVQSTKHYTALNMRIKAQLLELDRDLQGTGQSAVLIKGAAQLFDGVYPGIGMRHMADIDLLVLQDGFDAQLQKLGYLPKDPAYLDRQDSQGRAVLGFGRHHLTAVIRPKDVVTIEPHLLATSPTVSHLLPADVTTALAAVPGCSVLMQPSRSNHLIINLIHTLKHDRDTLDGGLLMRGLVECELIYARLTQAEQDGVALHFVRCGAQSLFAGWRALADWLFLQDDTALMRNIAGFLLISECRLRARGYRMVFTIAMAHRVLALTNHRYWTSGKIAQHGGRFLRQDFWARFFNRLRQAYKG